MTKTHSYQSIDKGFLSKHFPLSHSCTGKDWAAQVGSWSENIWWGCWRHRRRVQEGDWLLMFMSTFYYILFLVEYSFFSLLYKVEVSSDNISENQLVLVKMSEVEIQSNSWNILFLFSSPLSSHKIRIYLRNEKSYRRNSVETTGVFRAFLRGSHSLCALRPWRTKSSRPRGPSPRSRGPEGP